MGKFTNKTTDGAKRLFALLAVLILLFSGFAHVLATNFGRVKIEIPLQRPGIWAASSRRKCCSGRRKNT